MLFLVDGSNRLVVKEEAEQSSRGLIDVRVRCVCCGCDQKEVLQSFLVASVSLQYRQFRLKIPRPFPPNFLLGYVTRFLCLAQSSLTCLAPHFEFERLRDDSDDYGLLFITLLYTVSTR